MLQKSDVCRWIDLELEMMGELAECKAPGKFHSAAELFGVIKEHIRFAANQAQLNHAVNYAIDMCNNLGHAFLIKHYEIGSRLFGLQFRFRDEGPLIAI